jgi:hypothetical protein
MCEPRQRRSIRAQQERRLDQVTLRLLDRQRCQFAVVQGSFCHHPIDRSPKLLFYLRNG